MEKITEHTHTTAAPIHDGCVSGNGNHAKSRALVDNNNIVFFVGLRPSMSCRLGGTSVGGPSNRRKYVRMDPASSGWLTCPAGGRSLACAPNRRSVMTENPHAMRTLILLSPPFRRAVQVRVSSRSLPTVIRRRQTQYKFVPIWGGERGVFCVLRV